MSSKLRYEAALAAEDWDTAEAILRQGYGESGDQHLLVILGAFLRKRGRLEEAEALMSPAAEIAPTAELLDHLALIQYERQSFANSEKTLERRVGVAPGVELSTYQMLAKLKSFRLGPDGARDVMRRAREANPDRTEFVAAYADTLPTGEAIAELEKHLLDVPNDPGRTAYVLLRLTTYRAPILREMRGLPYFGTSWADTIQWPDPENLSVLKDALLSEIAMGSRRATARYDLANIAISEGDWNQAETYLAALRDSSKRTPADFIAFGSAFHAALEAMSHPEIIGGLAPVKRIRPPRAHVNEMATVESVYMASDKKYFMDFTLPFLHQLEAMSIPLPVHVHILDGDEFAWKGVHGALDALNTVNATLTAEASGVASGGRAQARTYYHAVRYVRFYEELLREKKPMWIFDCDVELLRDPRPFLMSLRACDVALKSSPCMIDPHLKITASSVGVMPTERGLEFARRVAAYIIHWKDRGTWGWGVDQAALLSSYAHMTDQGRMPNTLFLDEFATNERVGDTGAIRFMPGIGKYAPAKDSPTHDILATPRPLD